MALPLSRPSLRRQDFDQVLDAMVHDRLASGEIHHHLGKELQKAFDLKEAFVYSSPVEAARRVLTGLGLQTGDAVALSPLAPAWWPAALEGLGLKALWTDVLETCPVVDPEAARRSVEAGARVLVADTSLGFLPDFEALGALGVPVIEDVTQGLGGTRGGRPAGTFGQAVVAAFAPETLVAGAGGALAGFRSKTEGAEPGSWEGLSDLGSALILSQWKDAPAFAEKKREHLRHLFHRLPKGYKMPAQPGDADPVAPWFPVLVENGAKEVLAHARKRAVDADFAFRGQPQLHADSEADFCPRARWFLYHTLVFPLYASISLKELELLGKVVASLP